MQVRPFHQVRRLVARAVLQALGDVLWVRVDETPRPELLLTVEASCSIPPAPGVVTVLELVHALRFGGKITLVNVS